MSSSRQTRSRRAVSGSPSPRESAVNAGGNNRSSSRTAKPRRGGDVNRDEEKALTPQSSEDRSISPALRKSRGANTVDKNRKDGHDSQAAGPDYPAYAIMAAMIGITAFMYPWTNGNMVDESGKATVGYVFFYGWLTAIFTGLGVLPFFFRFRAE